MSRLSESDIPLDSLWAGTIHSFALEWVLRPYAPYMERLRTGFQIADEFYTDLALDELRKDHGCNQFLVVNVARDRRGQSHNGDPKAAAVCEAYRARLLRDRLLDYDDVLFLSYELLNSHREVARTLASIIRLICVDEIQDTQDLQYGILSSIAKSTDDPPMVFLVGDADQCIYESLGAVTKCASEIADEFGFAAIEHLTLKGNYRSTQRIVDFYQKLRPGSARITSLTDYSTEPGLVTFQNQNVDKSQLPEAISLLIRSSLNAGVPPSEICVLAPHWRHVRSLARSLVRLLPDVDFDSPGLSPFHSQRDSIWFKIARLFLTDPNPALVRTRLWWARDAIHDLEQIVGSSLPEESRKPRSFLRLVNSTGSAVTDGLAYLREVFAALMKSLGVDVDANQFLREAHVVFFEKAQKRIADAEGEAPTTVSDLRRLFRHPSGVVVSTCHGVKGEEYDTVISFGLLRGYVPNWEDIIHGDPGKAEDRASKLLYVVCSRAKRRLHLIAESGRATRNRSPYETTTLLRRLRYQYDTLPRT
jgi:superfamily I DNA/RNA helicase